MTTRPPNALPATWLGALLLLLAVFVVYQPSWSAGYLWDDDDLVHANVNVTSPSGLPGIWKGEHELEYFPLTRTLFWIQWRLWPDDSGAFHRVNLLLHGLGAVAVWRVLLALAVPGAWWAALVFAVHPVAAASVAWISESKNTLSLLLAALCTLFFLKSETAPAHASSIGRRSWWVASWLSFGLALLSKTSVVPLPFVLLACSAWRRGRPGRRQVLAVIPHLALAVALGLVTIRFQHSEALGAIVPRPEGLPSRLAVAGMALWFYLGNVLWPSALSALYPRWDVPAPSLLEFLPGLAWLGVLAGAWVLRHRGGRGVLLALGTATLLLTPVLGLVTMSHQALSLVADHFCYLALVPLCALAVAAPVWLWRRGRTGSAQAVVPAPAGTSPWPGLVAGLLAVSVLGTLTWQRSRIYADTETLCRDILSRNDASWFAHNNLAAALLRRDSAGEAEGHLLRAIQLNDAYSEPLVNLAYLRSRAGADGEAQALLLRALALKPQDVMAHLNLADVHLALGEPAQARASAQTALGLVPEQPKALLLLGQVALAEGRLDDASAWFQRSLASRPSAAAHGALGVSHALGGQTNAAESSFRAALALSPHHAESLNNLGRLLADRGRTEEARQLFRQALVARPGYEQAAANLRDLDG